MAMPGVFSAAKLNGTIFYRASLTHQNKHISLGSFQTERAAHAAYTAATKLLSKKKTLVVPTEEAYKKSRTCLPFDKWVMLLNLRDNGIYCRNPIYLQSKYFLYYLDPVHILKFDTDDLFYYMKHRIARRGGHLFVSDYGMQLNLRSRYGIKNFSVVGRDYRFVNDDPYDFRYQNIQIINRYHGVVKSVVKGRDRFTVKIHINGDYLVGRYPTEIEGAIAYNKAANLLHSKGLTKEFPENYIDSLDHIAYAKIYNSVRVSRKIREYEPPEPI